MEGGGDVTFAQHRTLLFLVGLHAAKDVVENIQGLASPESLARARPHRSKGFLPGLRRALVAAFDCEISARDHQPWTHRRRASRIFRLCSLRQTCCA